jgi:hypothetical protein
VTLPAVSLEIVPVERAAALARFVRLPDLLARGDPAYVAPLHDEQRKILTPKHNTYFEQAEACYWLARRDGRDVGRISAQWDRRVGREGHFGMLAAEDDPAVFRALFDAVEAWHRARGNERILGPFDLSANESLGVLVDGFGTPPMLLMSHGARYVGARVEEQGYGKAKDLIAYLYDTATELPPGPRRMVERTLPAGLVIRPLDMKRYADEVKTVSALFNDAWADNWGFVPLSEAETDQMARQLKMLLNAKLIWFAEFEGEPIGFIVALPNLNEAIADLDGRLLPFGWAKLLWRLKVSGVSSARIPLMGVRRSFQRGLLGTLVPFLLIDAVRREGLKLGYRSTELSWILEDNAAMCGIIEALGGVPYKTYRLYEKAMVAAG